MGRRKGRTRRRDTRPSALIGLAAALALVVQLLAVPFHQARAYGLAPNTANVAAALKSTFGDAAALCSQTDGKGAPAPAGGCDDQCPLCRFASQAVALLAPDSPALPVRFEAFLALRAPPERGGVPLSPSQPNRARAPPLAV